MGKINFPVGFFSHPDDTDAAMPYINAAEKLYNHALQATLIPYSRTDLSIAVAVKLTI